ncbi:MAG: hypothetical protein FDZ70_07925, partial [Actinobacteria bacterium]
MPSSGCSCYACARGWASDARAPTAARPPSAPSGSGGIARVYNLRYHIASLVSVFLALAVGLVLGTVVVE